MGEKMATGTAPIPGIWERYLMAMDAVTDRLNRITTAFTDMGVPFALVGGQAVALWRLQPKTRPRSELQEDCGRILLQRADLLRKRKRPLSKPRLDYVEVVDVGMFLERTDPNPRHGVHLVWADEKVKADDALPTPKIDEREELEPGKSVVSLAGLVRMKLTANRDQDRVHLRDMIGVGLIDRSLLHGLPTVLAARLDVLLNEAGR